MHEPDTAPLERSPTTPSLAPEAAGLAAAPDGRGLGVSEGAVSQWMARAGDGGPEALRPRPPAGAPRRLAPSNSPACPNCCLASARLRLPRRTLDPQSGRRHHPFGMWCLLSPASWGSPARRDPLESAKARPAGSATRRSRHGAVARRHVAGHQKGAQAPEQTLFFIDESGLYPLPSVARPSAPVGQTPMLRAWDTRDHLSAISAISPEGKLYFHAQDHAMDSADVVACLAHLLREGPGRMLIIWDGAPMHRRHASRRSWPMAQPNGCTWSACRRMPPNSIQVRASGNSSTGSSGAMSAASISRTCGMSGVTRSNGFGKNHACFKAFSKEQDFKSLGPGQ